MTPPAKYPARIWQFKTTVAIPDWIAGDFADAGHELIHRSGYKVKEGECIINHRPGQTFVVSEQEFEQIKAMVLPVTT